MLNFLLNMFYENFSKVQITESNLPSSKAEWLTSTMLLKRIHDSVGQSPKTKIKISLQGEVDGLHWVKHGCLTLLLSAAPEGSLLLLFPSVTSWLGCFALLAPLPALECSTSYPKCLWPSPPGLAHSPGNKARLWRARPQLARRLLRCFFLILQPCHPSDCFY